MPSTSARDRLAIKLGNKGDRYMNKFKEVVQKILSEHGNYIEQFKAELSECIDQREINNQVQFFGYRLGILETYSTDRDPNEWQ